MMKEKNLPGDHGKSVVKSLLTAFLGYRFIATDVAGR
jgi:hypothetical protein